MIKIIIKRTRRTVLDTVKIRKAIRQHFRDCTQTFIITVLDSIVENIDTGMSAASLEPFAAKVGLRQFIHATIQGRAHGIKLKTYYSTDFPGLSSNKSISHGTNLGEQAYTYTNSENSNKYSFTFKIVVLQYYLHENGLAVPSSHFWNSLDKGRKAFLETWNPKVIINKIVVG